MIQADLLRVKQLFQAAADLPPGERAGWLDAQGIDDAVRAQVELQLHLLDTEDDAFQHEVSRPTLAPRADVDVREAIADYELLEPIGEGGFGTVWRARQLRPVDRIVALKVIKVGMDTRQVVARFEAERQALALMDHPDIAKVLDGGATASGRPYFAMELVEGVPITDYCDRHHLDTRARLRLFQQICQAVQHAHQKGVIHRDLKPSNILVADQDGRPRPKIIDFGIAKATAAELTQKTLFTDSRQMVGTPEYMSPEQAELTGADVDTRADVYSLGVLLFEMLTGTLPFDVKELREQGYLEVLRVIREEEPPKPSTRVSTMSVAPGNVRARHVGSPQHLQRALRGDLDWITLRALEKNRERRYASAAELAADVDRHLRHEPVVAGPQTAGYRVSRFVRKHRTAVTAVAFVLLALTLGAGLAVWGLLEARSQRDEAQQRQRELDAAQKVAVQQRDEARSARQVAERAVSFWTDTIALTNPDRTGQRDVTTDDLLERATAELSTAFADAPRTEARLRAAIGQAAAARGRVDLASENLVRAMTLFETVPGVTSEEIYEALWPLWYLAGQLDQGYRLVYQRFGYSAIDVVARSDIELQEAAYAILSTKPRQLGDDSLDTMLALARAKLAPADPRWLALADLLAFECQSAFVDRPRWFEAAHDIYDRLGLPPTHSRVLLARLLHEGLLLHPDVAGFERSIRGSRETLARMQEAMPGHWYADVCRLQLADALLEIGEFEAAKPHLDVAVANLPTKLGPHARQTLWCWQTAVKWHDRQGRTGSPETEAVRNALCRAIADYPHPCPCEWTVAALGPKYADLGERVFLLWEASYRPEQSIRDLRTLIEDCQQRIASDDPLWLVLAVFVTECCNKQSHPTQGGSPRAVLPMLEHAVAVLEPAGACNAATALEHVARLRRRIGHYERAAAAATRSLLIGERFDVHRARCATELARCRFELGHAAEAIELAMAAYHQHAALLGEDRYAVAIAFEAAIRMLRRSGRYREAVQQLEARVEKLASGVVSTSAVIYSLTQMAEELGRDTAAQRGWDWYRAERPEIHRQLLGPAVLAALRYDARAAIEHVEGVQHRRQMPSTRLQVARIRARLGQRDEAIELATGSVEQFPSNQRRCELGELHLMFDELEPAAELAREALAREPEFGAAHGLLARIELRRGDLDAALAAANRSLECGGDHSALARVLCARGEARAIEHFEAAARLAPRPDADDFWIDYANALAAADRTDDALAVLDEQTTYWPEEPHAFRALARFLLTIEGRHEQALAAAERAAALANRRCPNVLTTLAEAQWQNGAVPTARATLAEVRELMQGRNAPWLTVDHVAAQDSRIR